MDRWDLEERQKSIQVAKQIIVIRDKLEKGICDRIFQNCFYNTHVVLTRSLRKRTFDEETLEKLDKMISDLETDIKNNEKQIKEGKEILEESLGYIKGLWPEYAACKDLGHDFRAIAKVVSKMPINRFTKTCQRCSDTESGFY